MKKMKVAMLGIAALIGLAGCEFLPTTSSQPSSTVPAIPDPVLESIVLGGSYETEFFTGEEFNYDGLTVTAYYDDGSSESLTNGYVVSQPDMAVAGSQNITVSYTDGDVTKTDEYMIVLTVKQTNWTAHEIEVLSEVEFYTQVVEAPIPYYYGMEVVEMFDEEEELSGAYLEMPNATEDDVEAYCALLEDAATSFVDENQIEVYCEFLEADAIPSEVNMMYGFDGLACYKFVPYYYDADYDAWQRYYTGEETVVVGLDGEDNMIVCFANTFAIHEALLYGLEGDAESGVSYGYLNNYYLGQLCDYIPLLMEYVFEGYPEFINCLVFPQYDDPASENNMIYIRDYLCSNPFYFEDYIMAFDTAYYGINEEGYQTFMETLLAVGFEQLARQEGDELTTFVIDDAVRGEITYEVYDYDEAFWEMSDGSTEGGFGFMITVKAPTTTRPIQIIENMIISEYGEEYVEMLLTVDETDGSITSLAPFYYPLVDGPYVTTLENVIAYYTNLLEGYELLGFDSYEEYGFDIYYFRDDMVMIQLYVSVEEDPDLGECIIVQPYAFYYDSFKQEAYAEYLCKNITGKCDDGDVYYAGNGGFGFAFVTNTDSETAVANYSTALGTIGFQTVEVEEPLEGYVYLTNALYVIELGAVDYPGYPGYSIVSMKVYYVYSDPRDDLVTMLANLYDQDFAVVEECAGSVYFYDEDTDSFYATMKLVKSTATDLNALYQEEVYYLGLVIENYAPTGYSIASTPTFDDTTGTTNIYLYNAENNVLMLLSIYYKTGYLYLYMQAGYYQGE